MAVGQSLVLQRDVIGCFFPASSEENPPNSFGHENT